MTIARQRGLDLLSIAGMPWRFARQSDVADQMPTTVEKVLASFETILYKHSWTGRVLVVTPERSGTDLVHELCHWLIAPATRRRRREYGLGTAPWGDLVEAHFVSNSAAPLLRVSHAAAYDEEICTSVLDVYLHRTLRGGWRDRAEALNLVPFRYTGTWSQFLAEEDHIDVANEAVWNKLRDRGLVDRVARRAA